jgi:hypothetical protein
MPWEVLAGWIVLAGLLVAVLIFLLRLARSGRDLEVQDRADVSTLRATLDLLSRQVERLGTMERTLETIQDHVGTLTAALLGRKTGQVGERVAEEFLSHVPDACLRRRVRMGDGEVEFAVALPGERLVPVDSKFVAPELVVAWERAEEATKRAYERRIAQAVRERAQEVASKYLADSRCAGFGVAAVPDPVYALCLSALRDLGLQRILLVPYTLLVPYVLSLYFLGQRLGIGQIGEAERAAGRARDGVLAAISELEKMTQEITTVSNQRHRALEHLRRAALALDEAIRSEEGGP